MTQVYTVCFVIVLIVLPNIAMSTKPLLKTKLGLIQGLEADDGEYFMFLGVPYAKVNETNPFGESLPHPPFDTIFEAYDDSIMCPQKDEFNDTLQGTINCLTLNIYVPKSANSTNKLPILLYIYGGNYKVGFNGRYVYGPKYLVRHDIIVVILNYRLGPYGFLCLDIPEVPGNQGYKDQKNALRWLHNNIEEFGGDRNKITIDGHSSGANSVNLILHSLKENENLFDKVILQSGPNLTSPSRLQTSHEQDVLKMAKYLGLITDKVTEAITFLSSVNPSLVIDVSLKMQLTYSYCIEKTFENVDSFIPYYQWDMKVPGAKNISFMLGNTDKESLFLFGLDVPEISKTINIVFHAYSNFNMNPQLNIAIAKLIHNFFRVNQTLSKKIGNAIHYGTELNYLLSSKHNMLKYLENGARDVYYYLFSYNGQRNFLTRKLNLTFNKGATHADEISYLFDLFYMEEPSPDDKLIIDRLTTLWANFVKYGTPTPVTSNLLPVKWIPYSKKFQKYLNIDTRMCLECLSNRANALKKLFSEASGP